MFEGLLQPVHLILILILVLIVFGPGKLPEVGSALGKGIRELRRGLEAHDDRPSQHSGDAAPSAPPEPPRG